MKKESDKKRVLRILQEGKTLTSMDGLMMNIVRITNSINELRHDGYSIQDKWRVSKSRKRYKIYFMSVYFDKSKLDVQ